MSLSGDQGFFGGSHGLLSARPNVGLPGRTWWTDDTHQLFREDGKNWYELALTGALPSPSLVFGTAGPPERRLSFTQSLGGSGGTQTIATFGPLDPASGAILVIAPGATHDQSASISSQTLWYNQTGTNYQRWGVALGFGGIVVDSTYNGAGPLLPVSFQTGGSVSNAVPGQEVLRFNTDASVDLAGSHNYTSGGVTFAGSFATRIADSHDTGNSLLTIDTRTTTPGGTTTADSATLEYRRGGLRKWITGLNAAGANVDSFDWMAAGPALVLSLLQSGQFKTVAGNETTGGGSALLGANCPAATVGAPYRWEKITTSDGSQCYFPVWK